MPPWRERRQAGSQRPDLSNIHKVIIMAMRTSSVYTDADFFEWCFMCRLFAFKSDVFNLGHHPLLLADNALMRQSVEHPDGWGLAYYTQGVPHVLKSLGRAQDSKDFERLSRNIVADTMLAHIRRRTQGDISLVNCHPFQYGSWVMAHNGDLPGFSLTKEELLKNLEPQFLRSILGSTDSEVYFALILQELKNLGILNLTHPPVQQVAKALRAALKKIVSTAKKYQATEEEASLNVILSNGSFVLAYRKGRQLNYSAHHLTESKGCLSSLSVLSCHNQNLAGGPKINHLLISSEPLNGEKIWQPLSEDQIIALDHSWTLYSKL